MGYKPLTLFSCSQSTAMTTSYAPVAVTKVPEVDARSRPLPSEGFLYRLEGVFTDIVDATKVSWFLAKDAAGTDMITDIVLEPLLDPYATGSASVNTTINSVLTLDSTATEGTVWVHAKMNSGSANLIARIIWEARS